MNTSTFYLIHASVSYNVILSSKPQLNSQNAIQNSINMNIL